MTRFESQQSRRMDPEGHGYVTGMAEIRPQGKSETSSLFDDMVQPLSTAGIWGKRHPIAVVGIFLGIGLGIGVLIGRPWAR